MTDDADKRHDRWKRVESFIETLDYYVTCRTGLDHSSLVMMNKSRDLLAEKLMELMDDR